jgi:UDP-2,3-diacylglucosamine hydrolase
MPPPPVFFASDVHMGAISREQEEAFYGWLEHVGEEASRLVLNGDLFDFWFEYRGGGIPPGYDALLARLRTLVDAGLPVTLMGGNHDWWGGRHLREEVGLEFLREPVVRDFAGRTTLLAHGDGLGEGDLGYRVLKVVLRGRLTRWAFAQLGPALGDRVAGRVSATEGRWTAPTPRDRERAGALERWALEALEARPELELVVLGHTHVPALVEAGPGRWYVNTGDWVHHRSYMVLAEGEPPRLLDWEGA